MLPHVRVASCNMLHSSGAHHLGEGCASAQMLLVADKLTAQAPQSFAMSFYATELRCTHPRAYSSDSPCVLCTLWRRRWASTGSAERRFARGHRRRMLRQDICSLRSSPLLPHLPPPLPPTCADCRRGEAMAHKGPDGGAVQLAAVSNRCAPCSPPSACLRAESNAT